jgi:tRNA(Arg) A34 adenosine deaminase TadA
MFDDPRLTETEAIALRQIIARALEAARSDDRCGIAAAIVCGDQILETAENEVNRFSDPTKHAEMVALAALSQREDRKNLGDCTLISTLQPCEMCLSAMRFAGIKRVIYAATQDRVAEKYFVFPTLRITDFQASGESFEQLGGIGEDEVLHLYATGKE